jgi:alkylation response protein AidB-like acyl-CoA dehydrogenase
MSQQDIHPCIAAVRELGPAFADRAAGHDRSGDFVAENYAEMKAKKLFSAGVPAELGGGGASHAQLCQMVRELAGYCPSTALALSMHTHLIAANTWRHLHGQPAAPLLEKVAQGELVLVSTGGRDWLDSNGQVEKVDGGYRVSADKRFGSGGPAGDIALTSAPYLCPERGWRVLHFPVPLGADGVSRASDWNTLGMRGTGSDTILFDGVFIPDAAVGVDRERGPWAVPFNVIGAVALPLIVAAYVGVAERAAELARTAAAKKQDDPHMPYLMGELENQLMIARMCLQRGIDNARGYDFAPELDVANEALICKTLASDACRRVLDKAVEISGGGAYFRGHPIEQLWRDVQAIQFHPLPQKRQLHMTGRIAMGLPPV